MNLSDWDNVYTISEADTNYNWQETKLREIDYAFRHLNKEGFIAEFGTWKNYSINYIAKKTNEKIYGFDSLEGLPEQMYLGNGIFLPKNFDFSNSLPLESNVEFYKGWFADTIPIFIKEEKRPAKFINIDGDLYSSAIDVLYGLNDRIIPGTIIRFDELACWRTINTDQTPYKATWQNNKPLPFFTTWKEHEWKALHDWSKKFNRKFKPIAKSWFLGGVIKVIM